MGLPSSTTPAWAISRFRARTPRRSSGAYAATGGHLFRWRSVAEWIAGSFSGHGHLEWASPPAWFSRRGAVRTGAASAISPGFAERVNFLYRRRNSAHSYRGSAAAAAIPTRLMSNFIRSLAVLPFHNSFVSLSQSGLTLLAANYDAPLPQPVISSVTSAADGASGVASGGLISIGGSNFSPSPVASGDDAAAHRAGQ